MLAFEEFIQFFVFSRHFSPTLTPALFLSLASLLGAFLAVIKVLIENDTRWRTLATFFLGVGILFGGAGSIEVGWAASVPIEPDAASAFLGLRQGLAFATVFFIFLMIPLCSLILVGSRRKLKLK